MVSQLGTVIEVNRHGGWTGNIETSWKTVNLSSSSEMIDQFVIERNKDGFD